MRALFLLLLATFVVAQLSEDCEYVNSATVNLTDVGKLKACFESYTLHQDVIDRVVKNLEINEDVYVYADIAMNPPSEPAGYFKSMNYSSGLKELKEKLASSGGVISEVVRPVQKFIKGFHDGHFRASFITSEKYPNIFGNVYCRLPFHWGTEVNGTSRKVKIDNPDGVFLPRDVWDTINNMSENGNFVSSVDDNDDPFEFFSTFFGDYNDRKSPQGSLIDSMIYLNNGFSLMRYPLDNIFDNHTIVFSDPSSTKISFTLAFWKTIFQSDRLKSTSTTKENDYLDALKNFKKRSVRQTHVYLPCGNINNMNYIQIDGFEPSSLEQYFQELVECVVDFDRNKDPITIILPNNGGGHYNAMSPTLFLLMPKADFRINGACRKTERTKHFMVDREVAITTDLGDDEETCSKFNPTSLNVFWNKTVVDDFGNVSHVRTEKAFGAFKDALEKSGIVKYAMKNYRKPTDIIVATDGACFSACSFFVNSIMRSGAAIMAGFGVTHPGQDLFAAGESSSSNEDLKVLFEELSNNTDYGLWDFSTTYVESYDPSNSSEIIPDEYKMLLIDKHTGYYNDFVAGDLTDIASLLQHTAALRDEFQTKCNPDNKRLLFVTEDCEPDKPFALTMGYACGPDGEWNKKSCHIASCEDGYVVDFVHDKCVPNSCDPRIDSSSSYSSGAPSSATSSAPSGESSSAASSDHPKGSVAARVQTTFSIALLSIFAAFICML